MAKGSKNNPNEEAAVNRTKQWSKAVDKTDKKIDEVNKSTTDPDERLRKLLEEE